ncbi:protein lin-54 homolog [Patella vulgata]|uniref:protein lin-54 homolog n=1 Tax=Patella vulgata TaxID=6465 RepID=UPI002180981A|nr:protein lin-54 homolog [Patella vulgata]
MPAKGSDTTTVKQEDDTSTSIVVTTAVATQVNNNNVNSNNISTAAGEPFSLIEKKVVTKTAVPLSGTSVKSVGTPIIVDASDASSLLANTGQTLTNIVDLTHTNDKQFLKRQISPSGNSGNPVITKVIIKKNPSTSQPQAVPVQMANAQGQTLFASLPSGISIVPQVQTVTQTSGMNSPTKTVTISSQGVVSSGGKTILALQKTPTKGIVPINKIPISPIKTPTKVTMIPVSAKSPQRYPTVYSSSVLSNSLKQPVITMSPSKVIIKQTPTGVVSLQQKVQTSTVKTVPNIAPAQQSIRPVTISTSNLQQIQVPGSRFTYVRLVSPSPGTVNKVTTATVQSVRSIAPASVQAGQNNSNQVKITLPMQGGQLVTSKAGTSLQNTQTIQRILLPAQPNQNRSTAPTTPSPLTQIRPVPSTSSTSQSLSQLIPGATLLPTGSNIQGYALVPANYVAQMAQQQKGPSVSNLSATTAQRPPSDFINIASSDPTITANAVARNAPNLNGGTIEATGARPRKPCNCTKSQCLKLYCDCFANGEFCHNCNCLNCANNLEHEEERSRAIKSCLDRNPMAFHPKIGKGKHGVNHRKHNKGCNCKRSGCLKNYCECYEAKIMCSSSCKCIGCKNFEESPERKTLMHLADAAEVRVQQQTAAKSKFSSQMSGLPSKPLPSSNGERLPYTLITAEVAEATCACLLAQAEEAERLKMPPVVQERMIIEEFGRCLMQIIESANKTKDGT